MRHRPSDQHPDLPDLPEMIDSGLSLTEALAFWSRMMAKPGMQPQEWWDRLKSLRPKAQ